MELKSVGFSHRSIGLVKNKFYHSTLETAVCQDVSNCENVVSPANQKVMTHTAKGNPTFFSGMKLCFHLSKRLFLDRYRESKLFKGLQGYQDLTLHQDISGYFKFP